jgi:hypothetical protein
VTAADGGAEWSIGYRDSLRTDEKSRAQGGRGLVLNHCSAM